MSSLGDQLYRAVTGGRPRELGDWRGMVDELVGKFGSRRKASAAVGMSRRTWERWATGSRPRASTIQRLVEAVRDVRLADDRPTDTSISLDLVERRPGKRDGTERTVSGKQLGLRRGTMAAVERAYRETGDPERMAAAFLQGVTVGFYKGWLTPTDLRQAGPADLPVEDEGDDLAEEYDAIDDLYEEYDGDTVEDVWDDLRGEEYEPPDVSYGFDVVSAG